MAEAMAAPPLARRLLLPPVRTGRAAAAAAAAGDGRKGWSGAAGDLDSSPPSVAFSRKESDSCFNCRWQTTTWASSVAHAPADSVTHPSLQIWPPAARTDPTAPPVPPPPEVPQVPCMTTKEEKPTLGGVTIKTRKRNIAVPLDPASFANAVIACFEDAEGETAAEVLSAGCKVLENSTLDFSRYGETLFEVLFAGGRMAAGGSLEEQGAHLKHNILSQEPEQEALMPFISTFHQLIRRRPFLIKSLENTMCKFLKSLEFFDTAGRKKISMATGMIFSNKLGVLPEEVFESIDNDRMIAKGTVAEFLTEFLREFLSKCSIDDLIVLMKKAKIDKRLLEFFPAGKRTPQHFNDHFTEAGIPSIVEYNKNQFSADQVKEMEEALIIALTEEQPETDIIKALKEKKEASGMSDLDAVKVTWKSLMASMNLTGKNQQQVQFMVLKTVKTHNKLLASVAKTARLEAALMVEIQVGCYEDSQKLKLFSDIIRILYDCDVIAEDTIHYWHKKGSSSKGRNVFMKDMEPFLTWLEEADEEEEDDEE